MTKKHFIEIAKAFALMGRMNYDAATLEKVANELAYTFKKINPAFDKARFLAACGF